MLSCWLADLHSNLLSHQLLLILLLFSLSSSSFPSCVTDRVFYADAEREVTGFKVI